MIDLAAEDGTAQRDYVVELGSERLVEEVENGDSRALAPARAARSRTSSPTAPHAAATVTVKELKERVLPPLDDDLATAASEFETLAELRADIEGRLRAQIDDEIEGLVPRRGGRRARSRLELHRRRPARRARTRELLNGLARSLQERGIDANTYLQLTGQTPEVLEQRLRAEASLSVSRELVLEAVADQLEIQVTDDEIRDELRTAGESDEDIEAFVAEGGADRVRDDIRLKKALDRIAAEVQPIAPELHEARESIWTPEKDEPAESPKLWTPGSKE